MDWESLYCPNQCCRYYGRPFSQGHLVKNGSSHGQKQARCKACETPVSIRYGTAYLDLHVDPAIFEMAVRALAEGNSIHATARIVRVDKDAVCTWLDRAAQHCRLVMLYLWRDLLALPHRRLRQPLPEPEPTRGSGSLRRWQPVTPAMAARLTDHVWTTSELLSYRVPPHFLDTLPALERLYPPFEEIHHGS